MKAIEKYAISRLEPPTDMPLWVKPEEDGTVSLKAYINGKWKDAGSLPPGTTEALAKAETAEQPMPLVLMIPSDYGSSLDAEPGNCYYLFAIEENVTINLPIYLSTFVLNALQIPIERYEEYICDEVRTIHIYAEVSEGGSLTFFAQSVELNPVFYTENFSIEPGNLYEISCLWNGYGWAISSVKLEGA